MTLRAAATAAAAAATATTASTAPFGHGGLRRCVRAYARLRCQHLRLVFKPFCYCWHVYGDAKNTAHIVYGEIGMQEIDEMMPEEIQWKHVQHQRRLVWYVR